MGVLIYAETQNGKLKGAALEAATYGAKVAAAMGTSCEAVVLGSCENPAALGKYGVSKCHHLANGALDAFNDQTYAGAIAGVATRMNHNVVIMSLSSTGRSLLGRLSVKLDAGAVAGVVALPNLDNGFTVRKSVFSGKAYADVQISSEIKVIGLMGNAITPEESNTDCETITIEIETPSSNTEVLETARATGREPLPDASLVVSAGRGVKDPDNWNIIEALADELEATTACSRPVADAGWRPHHEHVGQTGIAIRPNLYIAIGISGAIQHLAGVNNSKVIVVVNKDPEAPFFKAADYGVVGDLFDVVPKLTAALKAFKSA